MTLCVVVFIWISLMVTARVTGDSLQGHAGDHLNEWPPEIKTILLSEKVIGFLLKFLNLFHVSLSSTVIVRTSGVIWTFSANFVLLIVFSAGAEQGEASL